MAPEQVRGEDVDARSDLFALGATLYEMLHGQRPFSRRQHRSKRFTRFSRPSRRVSPREPPGAAGTGDDRHAPSEEISGRAVSVRRRSRRGRSSRSPTSRLIDRTSRPRDSQRSAWRTSAMVSLGAGQHLQPRFWWADGGCVVNRSRAGATPLMQFTWPLPAGMALDSAPVVSPDSQHVAFVGRDASGSRLFVRDLASRLGTSSLGTEGAKQPFWSPDSRSLGFFARGKLMKVVLAGWCAGRDCRCDRRARWRWSPSGTIVFSPDLLDLPYCKVSADGGRVEPATLLDRAQGENSHRWPVFLPDGIHFLYFVSRHRTKGEACTSGASIGPRSHPARRCFAPNLKPCTCRGRQRMSAICSTSTTEGSRPVRSMPSVAR